MTAASPVPVVLLLALGATTAAALEARVETRAGVPTLLINGQPAPPMILFHTAGGGAQPLVCDTGPQWQRFHFTFTAPADDANVGLHIRNIAPVGDWFVDDVAFREGTLAQPTSGNLIAGGDFEGDALPKAWNYFVNKSHGAAVDYSLSGDRPHGGQKCLRVDITHVGVIDYEIHVYQTTAVKLGRTYTFSLWLRSTQPRKIEVQAIHQGPPWTIYGGEIGASDRLLRLGAERGLHLGTPPMDVPWPRDGQPPDFAGVDAQVRHIVSIDPRALIIPRLHLDAPDWWKKAHPGHRQLYDKGEYPMASPASPLWRRDAEAALRLLLRHLEAKWGEHMLGYHVTAQSAGEWFYDQTWEPIMPCFEEPFRAAFAAWAKAKYGTIEALRQAWSLPEVTFETIRVPTLAERTEGRLGTFRDPVAQRFAIDFADYMQVCLSEYLQHCARVVKDETGRRKLSVFFYGYLYDVSGFHYGAAVSGHLRLREVLDNPDVDVICSPISYYDRQAGGVGPFMSPCDSVMAHGKLWLNEDDTRTHLAPVGANYGRTSTMAETLGVYRRNFGHQWERRCATWWMDFGTGWMADAGIFDNFQRTQQIWQQAAAAAPFRPQVAMVTDERSFLYLRNSNEVSAQSVCYQRRQFNTMGCPVGLYLMDDVIDGRLPDSVRLVVFLNAWRVTAEQRAALHQRLATGRRTAAWLYAPGYLDQRADASQIGRLTGIEVRLATAPKTSQVVLPASPAAPLSRLTGGHRFGVGFRPTPLFAVPEQGGVVPLGRYDGTTDCALALRRGTDWTSVFCGGLQLSAEVLRELARDAGAHIWCESNDVVSGNGAFVSIHATTAGAKTLVLPRAAALRDLYAGAVLPAASSHRLNLAVGETRVFAIEGGR